nr:PREDICTED: uncharacterized protein LOC105672427 [Linepithema humile]
MVYIDDSGSRFGSVIFLYLGCASVVFLFSSFIFANLDLSWISEVENYNKTSEKRLLLAAYCVFGNYTSFTYGLIEVLQALQILVNCISQCGNDGFFFDLTMHVCGQFEVLRMDFAEMSDEYFSRDKFVILIKRHHRLIYLAHHLHKAFNLVIFSQLLMSVMLLCIEGFQLILTLSIHDTFAPMKHVLFIVVLLVQLFLYCFAGQTLELQSQGLAYAVYDSSWYNFDLSVMKDLPLIKLSNQYEDKLEQWYGIWFLVYKDNNVDTRYMAFTEGRLGLHISLVYGIDSTADSFFFALTMHLCGQLELLRIRINELGKQMNEKNHYRYNLRSWIKRHYELIALAKNIEDSFNINLLIRILIITFTIAISGMRSLVSMKHQNYTDVAKSMMFIQYYIIQSFLFTHAGDALQNQSESIVLAIYNITWHELPYTTVKDLILIMMRTKIPLQLTAGKFFYITRRTTTDILKTALTYISFLQVTMEE